MASTLAAVLKRLYEHDRVTKDEIKERVVSGKLTEADYKYITGEDYDEQ